MDSAKISDVFMAGGHFITLGFNHPMGPLAQADFVALDICLHALETLDEGFADPKFDRAHCCVNWSQPVIWGRKTGKGFYQYGNQG